MEEENKWVETKKEYEVNEGGNLVIKKVTHEVEKVKRSGLERKDIFDSSLRVVGLLAIGIPVLLFYFQQKAERKRQNALLQIEVYSDVSTELHKLLFDHELSLSDFDARKNKLFYGYYPKMSLYDSKGNITTILKKINEELTCYSHFVKEKNRFDSVTNKILLVGLMFKTQMEFKNRSGSDIFVVRLDKQALEKANTLNILSSFAYRFLNDDASKSFFEPIAYDEKKPNPPPEIKSGTFYRPLNDSTLKLDSLQRLTISQLSNFENVRATYGLSSARFSYIASLEDMVPLILTNVDALRKAIAGG